MCLFGRDGDIYQVLVLGLALGKKYPGNRSLCTVWKQWQKRSTIHVYTAWKCCTNIIVCAAALRSRRVKINTARNWPDVSRAYHTHHHEYCSPVH